MALTDNLVAYWALDEASGNATDATGNGKTGTASGSPGTSTGTISGARSCTTGNFFTLNSGSLSQYSISAWVYLNSDTSYHAILTDSTSGFYVTSGYPYIFPAGAFADTTISTGVWKHLVATDNGTTITYYIDGSAHGTTSSIGALTFQGMGAQPGASFPLDGLLDECGLWSRALGSDEVTALYNGGAGLAYPFGATETVLDAAGTSLEITRTAATLQRELLVDAAAASLKVTPTAVALQEWHVLDAAARSLAITPTAIAPQTWHVLDAASLQLDLTLADATLEETAAGETLDAESAALVVTPTAITINRDYVLAAGPAALVVTRSDADFQAGIEPAGGGVAFVIERAKAKPKAKRPKAKPVKQPTRRRRPQPMPLQDYVLECEPAELVITTGETQFTITRIEYRDRPQPAERISRHIADTTPALATAGTDGCAAPVNTWDEEDALICMASFVTCLGIS